MKQFDLKLQPHVVVLCAAPQSLRDSAIFYAVLQNRVFYECGSLLEAVDVCFKSTFVFSLQYAAAAHSVWLYLQRAVYSMITTADTNPAKVMALLTDTK